ncbi:STAS domain-containing protein [Dyella tabacisoli]|uniref:STAS domain-containing protein n=1 Tax=Dyella tabacisoli TaxID=2282381 RepID=A0A369UIC0_9GAMM|nr:STAS domain-containing protein [Dyella tabacisoli]RDD79855.1 STAS domain-containing protein [Dyella tabacisoli]
MANKKASMKEPAADGQLVELPQDCRMAALPALQTQLLATLKQPRCILAAAEVARVDTTALQLLVAYRREAAAAGREIHWQGVSETLREAAALLGLAQVLELPAPIPA